MPESGDGNGGGDPHIEEAMKAEWRAIYKRLTRQAWTMEREMFALCEGPKGSASVLRNLTGKTAVLEKEYAGLRQQCLDDISEIKASVAKLKELSHESKTRSRRLALQRKLKGGTQFSDANAEKIEEIRAAIIRLERVHSGQAKKSEDEEVTLFNQIAEFQLLLHELEKKDQPSVTERPPKPSRAPSCSKSSDKKPAPHSTALPATTARGAAGVSETLPEVVAYEEFLDEHGPYGGWEKGNHECFEEMLRKFKGMTSLMIVAVQAMVAGVSREGVLEHGRWYALHEDLLLEKKAAIKAWRMQRDMARIEATSQRLEDDINRENMNRELEQRTRETEARRRKKQKEEIQEWKRVKKEKEDEEEAERQRLEQRRKSWDEKMRARRKEELSILMQQKRAAERTEHPTTEKALPSKADPSKLREFRQRDARLMQEKERQRTERHLILKEQSELQERIASTVRVRAPRDPTRLMRATLSEQNRLVTLSQERDEKEKAIQDGNRPNPVVVTPTRTLVRAVPGWRAELRTTGI